MDYLTSAASYVGGTAATVFVATKGKHVYDRSAHALQHQRNGSTCYGLRVCPFVTRLPDKIFNVYCRKGVLTQLASILSGSEKCNAVLVGPKGTGKSAIVKQLAKDIRSGRIPGLRGRECLFVDLCKIFQTRSLTEILGKASIEEGAALYFRDLLQAIRVSSKQVVLVVDEAMYLFQAKVFKDFKNELAQAGLPPMVLIMTNDEWLFTAKSMDEPMLRRFSVVPIHELDRHTTITVLGKVAQERYPNLTLEEGVVRTVANLSELYLKAPNFEESRFSKGEQPDVGVTFLNQVCAMAQNRQADSAQAKLTREEVIQYFRIPTTRPTRPVIDDALAALDRQDREAEQIFSQVFVPFKHANSEGAPQKLQQPIRELSSAFTDCKKPPIVVLHTPSLITARRVFEPAVAMGNQDAFSGLLVVNFGELLKLAREKKPRCDALYDRLKAKIAQATAARRPLGILLLEGKAYLDFVSAQEKDVSSSIRACVDQGLDQVDSWLAPASKMLGVDVKAAASQFFGTLEEGARGATAERELLADLHPFFSLFLTSINTGLIRCVVPIVEGSAVSGAGSASVIRIPKATPREFLDEIEMELTKLTTPSDQRIASDKAVIQAAFHLTCHLFPQEPQPDKSLELLWYAANSTFTCSSKSSKASVAVCLSVEDLIRTLKNRHGHSEVALAMIAQESGIWRLSPFEAIALGNGFAESTEKYTSVMEALCDPRNRLIFLTNVEETQSPFLAHRLSRAFSCVGLNVHRFDLGMLERNALKGHALDHYLFGELEAFVSGLQGKQAVVWIHYSPHLSGWNAVETGIVNKLLQLNGIKVVYTATQSLTLTSNQEGEAPTSPLSYLASAIPQPLQGLVQSAQRLYGEGEQASRSTATPEQPTFPYPPSEVAVEKASSDELRHFAESTWNTLLRDFEMQADAEATETVSTLSSKGIPATRPPFAEITQALRSVIVSWQAGSSNTGPITKEHVQKSLAQRWEVEVEDLMDIEDPKLTTFESKARRTFRRGANEVQKALQPLSRWKKVIGWAFTMYLASRVYRWTRAGLTRLFG